MHASDAPVAAPVEGVSGMPVEAEIHWPCGGASLYLRDPAGNSVELAPGRIWNL